MKNFHKIHSSQSFLLLLAVLCQLLVITKAQASAYWIDLKGSGQINDPMTLELCYGSMDDRGIRHRDNGKELLLAGNFKFNIIDSVGHVTPLLLTLKNDCWQGVFIPKTMGTYRILGINNEHPVVDRSAHQGINILPIDYICALYTVGSTQNPPSAPLQKLDLITERDGSQIIIKVFRNGKPSPAGTKLRVFNPENWEKELVVDSNGEAILYPTMPGTYIIRQDYKVQQPGIYQEDSYESIRYRCNYFLIWSL